MTLLLKVVANAFVFFSKTHCKFLKEMIHYKFFTKEMGWNSPQLKDRLAMLVVVGMRQVGLRNYFPKPRRQRIGMELFLVTVQDFRDFRFRCRPI